MSTAAVLGMVYFCCEERRRSLVRRHPTLNGIDFLEVIDADEPLVAKKQRELRLHLLKPLPAGTVPTVEDVRITGGVRVVGVRAESVDQAMQEFEPRDVLVVHVNARGDFSTYTLALLGPDGAPYPGFDPLLASVDFSFKVECPTDFDCAQTSPCPAETFDEPEIDYLSKDFASFRALMLDRLSIIMPDWRERNPADLGITLVELLAYAGDYLSYQQDAIATEAYLGTARRRISVRRHARLLDYAMSDGCNARVWVQVRTSEIAVTLPERTGLVTRTPGFPLLVAPGSPDYDRLLSAAPEVFETMHEATLHAAHNSMRFHTWGDRACCLPKGAVRAALAGSFPDLKSGDVLVFQETVGSRTGAAADADRTHRHAVRLTRVMGTVVDPLKDAPVTLIEWGSDDALPFALCISAVTDDGREIADVGIALGNIVLADHGLSVREESLGAPPDADPRLSRALPGGHCGDRERAVAEPRFRPRLHDGPLTMAATVSKTAVVDGRRRRLAFDPNASAAAAFRWEMDRVAPAVKLHDKNGNVWLPERDLLASDSFAAEFVPEIAEDGRAALRFGDDRYGMRPTPGVAMSADYRVGNGTRGNIGADSFAHVVSSDAHITGVFNPLQARGGVDPESMEHVRQSAPAAFRRQERAVTSDDYAEVTERNRSVQRAAATFRWTGSWRTVFVTVDRTGGGAVDPAFEEMIETHIERYRMAGHDLEIDGPRMVSLEIAADVCVAEGYYRSDVKRALLEAFSNRAFADGRRGFFHPEELTFAQPVYLSRLYALAQAVTGVASITFTTFRRYGTPASDALDTGVLAIGRLEIARLDNDRNRPENGSIQFTMRGGR